MPPSTEFNKQTDFDSGKLSSKKQNTHPSLFQLFSLPCRKGSKRSNLCTSSQQRSSQQRIICPTDFYTPVSDCSSVQLLGRRVKGMSSLQLFEWVHSAARRTLKPLSQGQSRGYCPHGHGGTWDRSWKPEWVGKHLVPASAVPSGFQLGDWR